MFSRNAGGQLPGDQASYTSTKKSLPCQFTFPHNGQQQAMVTHHTAFVIETAFLYGISTQNANSTRQFIDLVGFSFTALSYYRSIASCPARAIWRFMFQIPASYFS
jgi:hypothetical protein